MCSQSWDSLPIKSGQYSVQGHNVWQEPGGIDVLCWGRISLWVVTLVIRPQWLSCEIQAPDQDEGIHRLLPAPLYPCGPWQDRIFTANCLPGFWRSVGENSPWWEWGQETHIPGFCCPWLKGEAKKQDRIFLRKELRVSSNLLMKVHWMPQGSLPEMQYSTAAVILTPVCQNLAENRWLSPTLSSQICRSVVGPGNLHFSHKLPGNVDAPGLSSIFENPQALDNKRRFRNFQNLAFKQRSLRFWRR